jgi:beta-xylosidase
MQQMMKRSSLSTILLMFCLAVVSANGWQAYNGGGAYTNSPPYADFPDIDIIRDGNDFYFTTTAFVFPRLIISHSQDMVNWEYVSHVIERLEGHEQYDLENGNR